jgi:hypothetical protein
MWYVGIDWAEHHHEVAVLDTEGRVVATRRVAHSAEGLAQLTTWLCQFGEVATCPEQVACIVETRHGLLITALLEAGLLARKGRNELAQLHRLQPDTPLIAELKALTGDQQGLIVAHTRLANQLAACLKSYYPLALHLFSTVHQEVTVERYPTPEQAQTATLDALEALPVLSACRCQGRSDLCPTPAGPDASRSDHDSRQNTLDAGLGHAAATRAGTNQSV